MATTVLTRFVSRSAGRKEGECGHLIHRTTDTAIAQHIDMAGTTNQHQPKRDHWPPYVAALEPCQNMIIAHQYAA